MSKVIDYNDVFVEYDTSTHVTRDVLTKYEKTAVLSMRIEQLQRGAVPCVDVASVSDTRTGGGGEEVTPRDIALAELESGRLPFIVVRTLPNDKKEYWKLKDLRMLRNQ